VAELRRASGEGALRVGRVIPEEGKVKPVVV